MTSEGRAGLWASGARKQVPYLPWGVLPTTPNILVGTCLSTHTEITSGGGSERTVERLIFFPEDIFII